jgi:hypothetical protein
MRKKTHIHKERSGQEVSASTEPEVSIGGKRFFAGTLTFVVVFLFVPFFVLQFLSLPLLLNVSSMKS